MIIQKKITKVIAATLNCKMVKAETVDVDTLMNYDLIGFGSGIYGGKSNYNNPIKCKLEEKAFNILGEFSTKGLILLDHSNLLEGLQKEENSDDLKVPGL